MFIEEGEDKEQAGEKYKTGLIKERLLKLHIIYLLLDPKRLDIKEYMNAAMQKYKMETPKDYDEWYE